MTWQKDTIGNTCLVGDGAHAKIQRQEYGVLYLTCKNFKQGKLDLSKADYISEEDYEKYFREDSKALTQPNSGDILFSIIGTLGEPYIYSEKDRFGISSSVSILRPDNKKIASSFLFYWIKSDVFQKALFGMKGGVAQSYVSLDMIKALPINFPPLKTQEAIADILSKYDDLIENNQRRIELLEESARLLYREWFVYLRFPGHEHTPIIDGVPEGWEKGNVGNLAQVSSGYAFKSTDWQQVGNPVIKIKNIIGNGSVDIISCECINDTIAEKASKFVLSSGNLLIAMTGATVGKIGIIPPINKKYYLNQRVGIFHEKQINNIEYLLFPLFLEDSTQNQVVNFAGGAAQPNISAKQIESITALIPNISLIKLYIDSVSESFKLRQNLQNQNQKLQEARDILLPRLMSGEIAV